MKIGILAPYSRPWDPREAEGDDMNALIRESAEMLAAHGYEVVVFRRRSRSGDRRRTRVSECIIERAVDAGKATRLSHDDAYDACVSNSFPLDEVSQCDLLIAYYWIAEAWVSQIAPYYHAKILYFSHAYFADPSRSAVPDMRHRAAEIRLLHHVVWCACSHTEYEVMASMMPKEHAPVRFDRERFASHVTEILYEPTEPFRGILATVRREPTEVNGRVIPFEYYLFPGSVHVIPITAEGVVILISETRHDEAGATRTKIVSGMLSENESPEAAAHRELAEETGIRAGRMEKLVEIPESGAIQDVRHYYCAYDLSFNERAPDVSETIGEIHRFDIHDLYQRCLRGEMGAGKSVIALTALYVKMTTGHNPFRGE